MDTQTPPARRVPILGIGNLLWAGMGPACAWSSARRRLAPGRRSNCPMAATGFVSGASHADATHLLVFDAIDYGLAPGTLKLVRNSDAGLHGREEDEPAPDRLPDVLAAAQMLGHYRSA